MSGIKCFLELGQGEGGNNGSIAILLGKEIMGKENITLRRFQPSMGLNELDMERITQDRDLC